MGKGNCHFLSIQFCFPNWKSGALALLKTNLMPTSVQGKCSSCSRHILLPVCWEFISLDHKVHMDGTVRLGGGLCWTRKSDLWSNSVKCVDHVYRTAMPEHFGRCWLNIFEHWYSAHAHISISKCDGFYIKDILGFSGLSPADNDLVKVICWLKYCVNVDCCTVGAKICKHFKSAVLFQSIGKPNPEDVPDKVCVWCSSDLAMDGTNSDTSEHAKLRKSRASYAVHKKGLVTATRTERPN